ncbi:hypothetical protein [Neptunicella marina]|uniref:hypothetical protein n=1 Tax=Neptunicella marina TaxID=2125989 RepID=UPI00164550F8|nr:hypothetical protein [Neptunicella marina]
MPNAIDLYLADLHKTEQRGGSLYCEKDEDNHQFKSCEAFNQLKQQGCYGNSTYAMSVELNYERLCNQIDRLKNAKLTKVNYFDLSSPNWWQAIPAEIIPMSGGIYSDDSWKIAQQNRQKLVSGKQLGELNLSNTSSDTATLELILATDKQACGEINDTFNLSVKLVADFDNDGIAELLLQGYRVDRSDTCRLGSGNSLGAGFTAMIKKPAENAPIEISPFPAN